MSGNQMLNAFPWPEAAVADLRRMKADGKSGSEIAIYLSSEYSHRVTRGAVIGKAWRLGIETPNDRRSITISLSNSIRAPKKVKAASKPRPTPDRVSERRAVDLIKAARLEATVDAEAVAYAHADDIATDPKDIFGLTFSSCRWPLERTAEDGSALYCCNRKAATGSYCEAHTKRAYRKTQTPEQKRADSIERERNRQAFLAGGGRDGHVFGFGMGKRFV